MPQNRRGLFRGLEEGKGGCLLACCSQLCSRNYPIVLSIVSYYLCSRLRYAAVFGSGECSSSWQATLCPAIGNQPRSRERFHHPDPLTTACAPSHDCLKRYFVPRAAELLQNVTTLVGPVTSHCLYVYVYVARCVCRTCGLCVLKNPAQVFAVMLSATFTSSAGCTVVCC